jgi:enoyl-CoA hydratase
MQTGKSVASQDYQTLVLRLDDTDVLTVTLSRPEELNAVDSVMHDELIDLFGRLAEVLDIGAVVITGAGRAFCAGGDLDMIAAGNVDAGIRLRQTRGGLAFLRHLLSIRAPVIAAVNGPAVGLGATVALAADIAILARSAWLADPHVRVGLVAGDGGALVWPLLVGPARAKEFLMRASRIDSERAERIGLVNYVVEDAEVVTQAHGIAVELSRGAREAIAGTKLAVNAGLLAQVDQGIGQSLALEAHSWASEDIPEGVASLRDKREPRFPGSRTAWPVQ